MIVPVTDRPAGEHFALASALLRAHVVDGVPLGRLAADYGMSVPRLRTRLADHLAICTAALERPETPPPSPLPPAPIAALPVRIRVRERIEPPAFTAHSSAAAADSRAAILQPVVAEIRASGARTYAALARALNARGIRAPRGGTWDPSQAIRLVDRIANLETSS